MKISLVFAATLAASSLYAQINNNDSGTEILKPFRAKLAESKKINASPTQPKVDTLANKNLEYIVPTRLKELIYPNPKLQPLDLSGSGNNGEKIKIPSFYAKFGAGYPLAILGELSYHTPANKNYRFGATLRHHSGRGNYNDNQRFMENALRLQGAYFLKGGAAIDGNLDVNIDAPRFYGYGDTLELPKDSVAQLFTHVGGKIGFFNAKPNKMELNYRGDLGFHYLKDKYGTSEFSISPNVKIEKWFGQKTHKHPLVVDLGLNYVGLQDTFASLDTSLRLNSVGNNRLLVHFHPHFSYDGGAFRARVGTRLGVNEGSFYIYPDLEALGSLMDGKVNVYAGWSGAVLQNNFRTLSQYNPFVVSYLTARNTAQQDFYGGIKGSIKKYNYNLRVAYSMARNLPFFVNDSASQYRRFMVVYDTAQIFSVRGGLEFEIAKGLNFSANLGFFTYNLAQLEKAYHRPNFESNFNLAYVRGKFDAAATFYVFSGVPYFDAASQSNKTLGGLFDFNLSAGYTFTKNVGAFVQINNILNNQNQRWYRYPQIGFNALAGVRMSF